MPASAMPTAIMSMRSRARVQHPGRDERDPDRRHVLERDADGDVGQADGEEEEQHLDGDDEADDDQKPAADRSAAPRRTPPVSRKRAPRTMPASPMRSTSSRLAGMVESCSSAPDVPRMSDAAPISA